MTDIFQFVDVCTNAARESQEPAVSTCDTADNASNDSVVHSLQHQGTENFFSKQDAAVLKLLFAAITRNLQYDLLLHQTIDASYMYESTTLHKY